MAVVFLSLAGSFVFNLWGEKREVIVHPAVESGYFTRSAVRQPRLEAVTEKDGYLYRCNACHEHLLPSPVQKSSISAHDNIILEHGANNYCSTCHKSADREKLLDINKHELEFSQSHLTCLQCHGPVYRDWENGAHGRMNDYWDGSRGEVKKLTCVACHDPHKPAFAPMEPSPAPHIKNYRIYPEAVPAEKGNRHE